MSTVDNRFETGGAPDGVPSDAPSSRQPACKPGSVRRRLAPARDGHSSGTPVARRLEQPTRAADPDIDPEDFSSAPPLFGFAPGGVCRAAPVAGRAVRSYRTVSPLPSRRSAAGGLFSVALSLGSPPPDIIRHRMSMEPGLSSPAAFRHLQGRPSGRLTVQGMGGGGRGVKQTVLRSGIKMCNRKRRIELSSMCRAGRAPFYLGRRS